MVLSALLPENNTEGCLIERTVEKESGLCGKALSEIRLGENKLAVLVRRGGQVILPDGNTVLQEGDVLVLSQP